jgi:hypothetical protein
MKKKKILSYISASCIHNAFIKQIYVELPGICAAVQQNYHLLDENSSGKKNYLNYLFQDPEAVVCCRFCL